MVKLAQDTSKWTKQDWANYEAKVKGGIERDPFYSGKEIHEANKSAGVNDEIKVYIGKTSTGQPIHRAVRVNELVGKSKKQIAERYGERTAKNIEIEDNRVRYVSGVEKQQIPREKEGIRKRDIEGVLHQKYGLTYENPRFRKEFEKQLTKSFYTREEAIGILRRHGIEAQATKEGGIAYKIEKSVYWPRTKAEEYEELRQKQAESGIYLESRATRREGAEEKGLIEKMKEEQSRQERELYEYGLLMAGGGAFKVASTLPRVGKAIDIGGKIAGGYFTGEQAKRTYSLVKQKKYSQAFGETSEFIFGAGLFGLGYAKTPSFGEIKSNLHFHRPKFSFKTKAPEQAKKITFRVGNEPPIEPHQRNMKFESPHYEDISHKIANSIFPKHEGLIENYLSYHEKGVIPISIGESKPRLTGEQIEGLKHKFQHEDILLKIHKTRKKALPLTIQEKESLANSLSNLRIFTEETEPALGRVRVTEKIKTKEWNKYLPKEKEKFLSIKEPKKIEEPRQFYFSDKLKIEPIFKETKKMKRPSLLKEKKFKFEPEFEKFETEPEKTFKVRSGKSNLLLKTKTKTKTKARQKLELLPPSRARERTTAFPISRPVTRGLFSEKTGTRDYLTTITGSGLINAFKQRNKITPKQIFKEKNITVPKPITGTIPVTAQKPRTTTITDIVPVNFLRNRKTPPPEPRLFPKIGGTLPEKKGRYNRIFGGRKVTELYFMGQKLSLKRRKKSKKKSRRKKRR